MIFNDRLDAALALFFMVDRGRGDPRRRRASGI